MQAQLCLTPKRVLSLGPLAGYIEIEQKNLGPCRGANSFCSSLPLGPGLNILTSLLWIIRYAFV